MVKYSKGVSFNALLNYKNGNIASFALGVFYLIFPWLSSGYLNETMAIFGLVFLTVSIMRAKPSNTVIGGLFQAFIGVIYLFALAGLVSSMTILWFMAIGLAFVFFVFELGFVKFGPVSKKADVFQAVPFTILAFGLIISMAGYSTLFVINWQNWLIALNYVAVLLFCLTSALQLAGWNIGGKSTNTWLTVFAVAAIATSAAGVYQGSLFQWT